MNIFFTDAEPFIAAQNLGDKHVVKMILETAQLLSTAHHELDGEGASPELYKPTHKNHPSSIWVRSCSTAYGWAYNHLIGILEEYTYRYGKVHATSRLTEILKFYPKNMEVTEQSIWSTNIPQCMPDKYKRKGNPVLAYRHYYAAEKRAIADWNYSEKPIWWPEFTKIYTESKIVYYKNEGDHLNAY